MAYGDTPDDEELRKGWEEFCDQLKASAELIFRDGMPATPIDRAEGLRYLARSISLALDFELEHQDPLRPNFWRLFHPTRKQGGDNPDALYLLAPIDGNETYRIVGNLGSAHFVAITVMDPRPGPWGSAPTETMFRPDIQTEWDGSFVLTLSPDPQPGNWLRTNPKSFRVTVRQFFGDWEGERPMNVRIEHVGETEPPAPLTPAQVTQSLREAGHWLADSTSHWAGYLQARYGDLPTNHFSAPIDAPRSQRLDAQPGGTSIRCRWVVQPDEALIIEFTPSPAGWWNCEMNNAWLTTMDYRYHHCGGVNVTQRVLEEDGSVRIVISHSDPGVPNWLDTAGHEEGSLGIRWMLADHVPDTETRLVKLSDLASALPRNARRFDPAKRPELIRRRRIAIERRFRN